MNARAILVGAMIIALVSSSSSHARAQEAEEAATTATVMPPLELGLAPRFDRLASNHASLGAFAPSPANVRLSRGARTAIIVTAIVVGALLVLGTVVIVADKKHPGP